MSVGSQVTTAMRWLAEGEFEDAVIATSIAFSATARQEYPSLTGDKDACRKFVEDSLAIICKVGWVAFGVAGPMRFLYRRLDGRGGEPVAVRSMPEMLYDVVRCTAIHEARLPENLVFTDQPLIQTGMDGELVLPIDVVFGLVLAIVVAPTNFGERAEGDPRFGFGGERVAVNELWGDRTKLSAFIGIW